MKPYTSSRVAIVHLLLGITLALAFFLVRSSRADNTPVHLATDWSHHHLIFSKPKSLVQTFQFSRDVRYVQQWVRRNAERQGRRNGIRTETNRDWSVYIGSGGTVGAGMYPAKFSFDTDSAKCGTDPNPDFVVYNTGLVPSAAGTVASGSGTFTGQPTAGQTVTITNPNVSTAKTLVLTASATSNSNKNFKIATTIAGTAANLASRIFFYRTTYGFTATSSGGTVTVTELNSGNENDAITLASTLTNFTWSAGTLTGGTNGASIVAFDNLYSGCSGTVPSTYWAYNTGGTALTSVALSGDGSQVSFVQNVGSTAALVVLRWKASTTDTVDVPTTLTAVSNAAYSTCTAPCMTSIAFTGTGTLTDTRSAPFYDFATDSIYVGDDGGQVQKFTGIFNGTPAAAGGTWPVTLTAGSMQTSPVYDGNTGLVFIGDASGKLYSVNGAAGTVHSTSGRLAASLGIVDGPIVDPSSGEVYVFDSRTTVVACASGFSEIHQIPESFLTGDTGSHQNIGACSTTRAVYDGGFDNIYYNSPAGNAGNLYVCGNAGGIPTLYQIPFTGTGTLGTPNTGPALATAATVCSPVGEIYNPNDPGGAADWIFVSVQAHGDNSTTDNIQCPSTVGCLMSFDVTTGATIDTSLSTNATIDASGGASGIVMDNTVSSGTFAGASQIYYTPLSDANCSTSGLSVIGGCGTQASQSSLN